MAGRRLVVTLLVGCLTLLGLTACSTAPSSLDAALGGGGSSIVSVRAVGASRCVTLTGKNPTFNAPSWGSGVLFQGSGFPPNSPVALTLNTFLTSDPNIQTFPAETDASGNLNATWVPPIPAQAMNPSTMRPYYTITVQNLVNRTQWACQPQTILVK